MKTSKLIIAAFAVAAIAFMAIGATGCKKESSTQGSGQTVKYTCGMHPEVVQDKPGKCPKCGMALIEKR